MVWLNMRPPIRFRPSRRVTAIPARASSAAQARPAAPAPTTIADVVMTLRCRIQSEKRNLVASQGFEPRLVGSEPTVLPLNEEAILTYGGSRQVGTYDLHSF